MKKLVLIFAFVSAFTLIFAHEYFLMPAKFRFKKGEAIEMHLFVADGFNIQMERPFQKTITTKFELLTTDSSLDLTKQENGTLPVLTRNVDFEGGGLFVMERKRYARISLATDKFLSYLKEDHIENIAAKVDQSKKEQKERYTRYIKCLVQSENNYADTIYKTVAGQAFEIILLQNPYTMQAGVSLKAKILFNGKPLAGKMITARNRKGGESPTALTARTDKDGICSFKILKKGDWFIHATHMIPCTDQLDSDWESYWTSYSFGMD